MTTFKVGDYVYVSWPFWEGYGKVTRVKHSRVGVICARTGFGGGFDAYSLRSASDEEIVIAKLKGEADGI